MTNQKMYNGQLETLDTVIVLSVGVYFISYH